MHYISTRGKAPELNFEGVLLGGLASDGGLYVPKKYPHIDKAEIRDMREMSYREVAFEVTRPYIDNDFLSDNALRTILKQSYKTFSHEKVVPLKKLEKNLYVLELYHGQTLAFKDVALQPVARLFEHSLKKSGSFMIIVLATSGDTGAAAIDAFKGLDRILVIVLYPDGRISEVQRPFMTTVQDKNTYAVGVLGSTFDDNQSMVKAMLNDPEFKKTYHLGAVNSINFARIVFQIPYYFYAALQADALDGKIDFSVPTGNFGDIFAGYCAKQMGLPIHKLIIATNSNNILHRFMQNGEMATKGVVQTYSPSMDIEISSNFERLLFELLDRDAEALTRCMESLKQNKAFSVAPYVMERMRKDFYSGDADDNLTKEVIRKTYEKYAYQIDPHTAVGMAAAQKSEKAVVLSTASPAKFPIVVEECTGKYPALEPEVDARLKMPERLFKKPNDYNVIKNFVAACAHEHALA
ncbi:MAG: threonine synthase [Bdellovibrionales bacterium]